VHDIELRKTVNDPADDVELADTVGLALHVVLDRLSPRERVAFVLHDSFGFEFPTIASILDTTPSAARKLASRARAHVSQPHPEDGLADWEVVDAFMAAAKNGDFNRLLRLLAPDAAVTADDAAVLVGTPRQIEGREQVATFFNGSATAALPVFVDHRPGTAWFHLGAAKVVFDFTVTDGPRARHHLPRRARGARTSRAPRRRWAAQLTGHTLAVPTVSTAGHQMRRRRT